MQPLVLVSQMDVHYGKACAIEQVSFEVQVGSVVGLLGRNGAGKTTTLNTLMGLIHLTSGSYQFCGQDAQRLRPFELCRAGLSIVPADRQVFGELTVDDNLALAVSSGRRGPWTRERAYKLFPRLLERCKALADNLSGGEKQMLAIARAVLANPKLLLMDEPTEGLAPMMVTEVVGAIKTIRSEGVSFVIVEQNFKALIDELDLAYVLESGRMVWSGPPQTLASDAQAMQRLLCV
jgi:branched-chain amino acid transport system ATP-binding protein